ncbi:hypothetical protein SODG_001198 [Sodalis praecaptivus]
MPPSKASDGGEKPGIAVTEGAGAVSGRIHHQNAKRVRQIGQLPALQLGPLQVHPADIEVAQVGIGQIAIGKISRQPVYLVQLAPERSEPRKLAPVSTAPRQRLPINSHFSSVCRLKLQ